MNKHAYIMIGLPGSGKSTHAKKHLHGLPVVSSDNYIETKAQEEGKTYNEVFQKYIKEANRNFWNDIQEHVKKGESFVVDRTNLFVQSRKKVLNAIPDDYEIHAIFVNTDSEISRERSNRPGKSIPEHIFQNFVDGMEEPTESEGFTSIKWTGALDV